MRVITFKIDDDLLEMIDKIAHIHKKTRSTIIREALEDYVINHMLKTRDHKIIVVHTPGK